MEHKGKTNMEKLKKVRHLLNKDDNDFLEYKKSIIKNIPNTDNPSLVVFKVKGTQKVLKTTCTLTPSRRVLELLGWWLESCDSGETPEYVNEHTQADQALISIFKRPEWDWRDLEVEVISSNGYKQFGTLDEVKKYQKYYESVNKTYRSIYNDAMADLMKSLKN